MSWTTSDESELTSTSLAESSVIGASESSQLLENKSDTRVASESDTQQVPNKSDTQQVPSKFDTPEDCEAFTEKVFNDVFIVHSKYTCLQKNCVNLSSQEVKQIKSRGTGKDYFNHQWLLDPNIAYC